MKSCFLLLAGIVFGLISSPVSGEEKESESPKPPYYMTEEQLDRALGTDAKVERPGEFIMVVYFHRVPGCDTCQLMSKYVFETLKTRFTEDVRNKNIILRYQNFEDKKNASLVQRLKIQSPSLAIILVRDGKLVKAKMAGKIWSLAARKEKFMDYVRDEILPYRQTIEGAK